jgi:hypothetical protein
MAYRFRIRKKPPQYGTDCPEIDRIETVRSIAKQI